MPDEAVKKSSPNAGHRERLRRRFREHNLDNFQDYEALELLLLYVARQQDMKPVAKQLTEKFGSFSAVLDAPTEELKNIEGVGEGAVTLIHFVKQAAARYLEQRSHHSVTQQDLSEVISACRLKMGALQNEQFKVISLNASFVIVGEDIVAEGTIDQATVYPRKVVELAIKHGATTFIFVHNHPSGDVNPSEMDKLITRSLVLAARTVGVSVYEHIIVSSNGYFSFREQSLL
jgi:DNA repair protein RadC